MKTASQWQIVDVIPREYQHPASKATQSKQAQLQVGTTSISTASDSKVFHRVSPPRVLRSTPPSTVAIRQIPSTSPEVSGVPIQERVKEVSKHETLFICERESSDDTDDSNDSDVSNDLNNSGEILSIKRTRGGEFIKFRSSTGQELVRFKAASQHNEEDENTQETEAVLRDKRKTKNPKRNRAQRKTRDLSDEPEDPIIANLRPVNQPPPKLFKSARELREIGLEGVAKIERNKADSSFDPQKTNPIDRHSRYVNTTSAGPRTRPLQNKTTWAQRASSNYRYTEDNNDAVDLRRSPATSHFDHRTHLRPLGLTGDSRLDSILISEVDASSQTDYQSVPPQRAVELTTLSEGPTSLNERTAIQQPVPAIGPTPANIQPQVNSSRPAWMDSKWMPKDLDPTKPFWDK